MYQNYVCHLSYAILSNTSSFTNSPKNHKSVIQCVLCMTVYPRIHLQQNSIDLVVAVNPDVENQGEYEGKPSAGHDFAKSSRRAHSGMLCTWVLLANCTYSMPDTLSWKAVYYNPWTTVINLSHYVIAIHSPMKNDEPATATFCRVARSSWIWWT